MFLQARVIGYEAGKGSNTGKVGALVCVMACGKQFKVGSGYVFKLSNNIMYRFTVTFLIQKCPHFKWHFGESEKLTKLELIQQMKW